MSEPIQAYQKVFSIILNFNFNQDINKLQPDIITYSIVMKGFAKNNNITKVMDIYNFISTNANTNTQYSDLELDEVMFNTLLDCFARNNDEVSLFKIYSDMKDKNINMSIVTRK